MNRFFWFTLPILIAVFIIWWIGGFGRFSRVFEPSVSLDTIDVDTPIMFQDLTTSQLNAWVLPTSDTANIAANSSRIINLPDGYSLGPYKVWRVKFRRVSSTERQAVIGWKMDDGHLITVFRTDFCSRDEHLSWYDGTGFVSDGGQFRIMPIDATKIRVENLDATNWLLVKVSGSCTEF